MPGGWLVFVVVRGGLLLQQVERQQVGQVVRPPEFFSLVVQLDEAFAFHGRKLDGPQIDAIVDVLRAGVQAAFAADPAHAGAAHLHMNVFGVGFGAGFQRTGEGDPFVAVLGHAGAGQHGAAQVGGEGVGGLGQHCQFGVGEAQGRVGGHGFRGGEMDGAGRVCPMAT